MDPGSAENCATRGAAGGGGGVTTGAGGGGGGGGGGAFFLQPAAKIASTTARQMTINLGRLNMNISPELSYLPQTGE